MIGTIVGGAYRLTGQIGEGGMGSIWSAEHVRVGRKFAIKFLNAEVIENQEVFERFKREAEIAGKLGHPNIVEVVDYNWTEDGYPYIVMEHLEGMNLAHRLRIEGAYALGEAVPVISEVVDALEAAHAAGVVHRDLKPDNVFLCERGRRKDFVKLLDFGISKIKASGSLQTKTNAVMGTPYYMSPEQAQGQVRDIDSRTDVFALGAIVYEMLTGQVAFYAPSVPAALFKVCYDEPTPLRELVSGLPAELERVLAKALNKEKEQRYGSVGSFFEDLKRAAAGHQARLEPGVVRRARPDDDEQPQSKQTTLSGSATEALEAGTAAPARGTAVAVGVVSAVVVVAAAVAVGLVFGLKKKGSSSRKAAAPRPAATVPEPAREAASKEVTLTVIVLPKTAKATIYVDGKPIKGRSFVTPRSLEKAIELKVVAEGYGTATKSVLPNKDKELDVTLWRLSGDAMAAARPSGRAGRRAPAGQARAPAGQARAPASARPPAPRAPTVAGSAASRPAPRPASGPETRPRPGPRAERKGIFARDL